MTLRQAIQRSVLGAHQAIYERTDGRLGHRMVGVPALLLRTTGRRTGRPRTACLNYARDGAAFVVVASNHGLDKDPAWLFNLRAEPSVGIQVARRQGRATARLVKSSDPDYARLWELVNVTNRHRYAQYQRWTRRPIPLIVLTPVQPA